MVIQYAEGKNLYIPNIEKLEGMGDPSSLFHSVYRNAAEALAQMSDYKMPEQSKKKTRESHNTIIAFTGERGSGKTSTMLSFANVLKNEGAKELCRVLKIEKYEFNDCKFVVMPAIEPSHLTINESVLDVVISRMYTMFRENVEERIHHIHDNAANIENVRELNEKFSETHKAIRALCLNKEKRIGNGDSLENLKYIAAGNRIRDIFAELTSLFLEFIYPNNKGISRLVLCIDDLDLNPTMGYDICEDIRKYFDFPEAVILFSVKMAQLTDIIKRRFYLDFKELIEEDMLSDSIDDMAAKYLEKLIPVKRRCTLPVFEAFTMREVEIKYITKDENGKEIETEKRNLVDEVLRLVFEKTGIILLKNRHGSHDFIPTGLRSIVQLVQILGGLKDVGLLKKAEGIIKIKDPGGKTEDVQKFVLNQQIDVAVLKGNLDVFEDYLKEHSIVENMPQDLHKILRDMLAINWENLNQHLVRDLFDYIDEEPDSNGGYSFGIAPSLSRFKSEYDGSLDMSGIALPENISIGDALFLLNKIRNTVSLAEIERFIAITKVIYSARLVRLAFVDNINDEAPNNTFKNLHQLLGGLIYNPQGTVIIRGRRDWKSVFEYSSIKYNNEPISQTNQNDDCSYWLKMHTVSVGRYISNNLSRDWGRTEWRQPYYWRNMKLDAAYSCVSLSYLAPITNALLLEKAEAVTWANDYNLWRTNYISIIPVISADFMDMFIHNLPSAVDSILKAEAKDVAYYESMLKSIETVSNRLGNKSPVISIASWVAGALEFPIWKKEIHKKFDFKWDNSTSVGMARFIGNLKKKIELIEAANGKDALAAALKGNLSLRGIYLSEDDKSKARSIQDTISNERKRLDKLIRDSEIIVDDDIVQLKETLLDDLKTKLEDLESSDG